MYLKENNALCFHDVRVKMLSKMCHLNYFRVLSIISGDTPVSKSNPGIFLCEHKDKQQDFGFERELYLENVHAPEYS